MDRPWVEGLLPSDSGSSPPGFGTIFFGSGDDLDHVPQKTGKKDTEKGIDLQTKALHFQHKTRLWFQNVSNIFFYVHPDPWGNPILFTILLFDSYFSDGLVTN